MQTRYPLVFRIFMLLIFLSEISFGQTFTSSNLPIIVINTNGQFIPDEPKITADMGIIYNGPGARNNLSDAFNHYNGKIGIEVRGSSSQMFPKKQYGIELRDATGNGMAASLLGMPEEEDWILFAPYNDKSLMRDALAYRLGRAMGRYAPRTRFCEVVLNGQYQGVYVLIEKIKRDKNRVDIAKLDPGEISGDDLTGGYIIKLDKTTGNDKEGWYSDYPPPNRNGNQRVYFLYDYPKAADIVEPQRNYIRKYMADFEAALIGGNFNDPVNGYAKYIDVDSFIDFFIINEVSKNVDGYRLSTFMYKKKDSDGGKLHMGPIWDFNLGFGNANYCTSGTPEGWVTNFNNLCNGDSWLIPFWWDRLKLDGAYRHKLAQRWQTLRENELKTSTVIAYIDSVYQVLNAESQQRNFQRWPVLGQYVWPNFYVGPSFDAEVSWLKNWVEGRLNWLDINMPKVITATGDQWPHGDIIEIAPNPASQKITMYHSSWENGLITMELMDLQGRRVFSFQKSIPLGEAATEIVLPALVPGSYFYRISADDRPKSIGRLTIIH
jgi:hypothetical protein